MAPRNPPQDEYCQFTFDCKVCMECLVLFSVNATQTPFCCCMLWTSTNRRASATTKKPWFWFVFYFSLCTEDRDIVACCFSFGHVRQLQVRSARFDRVSCYRWISWQVEQREHVMIRFRQAQDFERVVIRFCGSDSIASEKTVLSEVGDKSNC